MPIGGSNRWTIRARLVDGKLQTVGRAYMSQAYVDDADEAVRRLLDGDEVALYQFFPFLQAVTERIAQTGVAE